MILFPPGNQRRDTSFSDEKDEVDGVPPMTSLNPDLDTKGFTSKDLPMTSAAAENINVNSSPVSSATNNSQDEEIIFKKPMPLGEVNRELNNKVIKDPSKDNVKDLGNVDVPPTPPASDTESLSAESSDEHEPKFKMPCLCKSKNCRKYLFF